MADEAEGSGEGSGTGRGGNPGWDDDDDNADYSSGEGSGDNPITTQVPGVDDPQCNYRFFSHYYNIYAREQCSITVNIKKKIKITNNQITIKHIAQSV